MKYFTFIFIFFFCKNSLGFTLSESRGRYFNNNEIDVHIAPTDCSGAGFTTSELASMVENAVEDYWNAVPTSALFLDVKGIDTSMDIDGLTHENAINTIVPTNSIVAGCNDDVTEFNNPAILGSAVLSCSDSTCKAVLILNAKNSNLNNKSSSEIEAVIAHELGHAFGLGHTEIQHNLMYYSTAGKTQNWLGQDDIDGVTYLYPHKPELLGLLGSCAMIDLDKEMNHLYLWQLILSLFIFGLGIERLKKLYARYL